MKGIIDMTPSEKIEQAFLHLSWAIKLHAFMREYPVDKSKFDKKIDFPGDNFSLPENQFNTNHDIILCAENSILLSVSALFLALDQAFEDAKIDRDPSTQDDEGQLRILIYMCRNAFAHNILNPQWKVFDKYDRQLNIVLPNISIQIDLPKFHEQPFDITQIGGYSTLNNIKNHVIMIVS